MPQLMLPISKQCGKWSSIDYILLSWANEIQIWSVAPISKRGIKRIPGVRSVFHFEWGCEQYCLVGTNAAELHLLKATDIRSAKEKKELTCLASARVLAPEQSVPITAISTLSRQEEDLKLHNLIFLGFADGSLRSYSMMELFRSTVVTREFHDKNGPTL